MKKMTLQFQNLCDLGAFSKLVDGGYLLNTCKLTITTDLDDALIFMARRKYGAVLIETTEKVFSYAL